MKISDEEAIAALNSWIPEIRPATCEAYVKDMRAALAAAYTVRKARKAAKRAKAKPSILDEDQQEALRQVNLPQFTVSSKTISAIFDRWKADIEAARQTQTEPVKPAWNGKFEVGKAYRTRGGQKVFISSIIDGIKYAVMGMLSGNDTSWDITGRFIGGKEGPYDLTGPWED